MGDDSCGRQFRRPVLEQEIRFSCRMILLGLIFTAGGICGLSPALAAEPVSFSAEIRPILAEHCFHCHGPDPGTRKADLRLDLRDAAIEFGAIVPGKPEESELIARIMEHDPQLVMPPPSQKKPLSPKQIVLLKQWVNEGAPYAQHWAFEAPRRPELPDVEGLVSAAGDAGSRYCVRNPIDHFVVQRLHREGLAMSPAAAPDILCRRLSLDLVGLPPSPQEVDEFVTAARHDEATAVKSLVERLLASPQFGEKWARHWLDVARYADSNGFEKDMPRDQWAWRDWVIDAINKDMPYDQFIIEQIAGDLLPNRTQEQLIASGFLRNGMVNEEGAIVYEQFRLEGNFDRMDCIGKAVLGLSLQCAQCHTHKFDPISHDEYYGLFAFLNDSFEAQSWVYTEAQLKQIDALRNGIAKIEQELKTANPDWKEQRDAWIAAEQKSAPHWQVLDTTEHVWEGGLNHPEEREDHSILVLGHPSTSGSIYVVASPGARTVTAIRLEALTYGDLPFTGPGRSYYGTFAVSEFEAFTRNSEKEEWKKLELAEATADFAEPDHEIEAYFTHDAMDKEKRRRVGPASFLIDGDARTAWRSDRGPILRHTESVAVVRLKEPLTLAADAQLKVRLQMSHGGDGNGRENLQLGRMRFSVTDTAQAKATTYDHRAWLAMQKPAAERTPEDEAALFRAWRQSVPGFKDANEAIARLEKQFPEAHTSVLHLAAPTGEFHRKTFLLDRGTWNKPRHQVRPHVPAVLHPLEVPEDRPLTRLDLARWLADERSPLTARVQVNRVWQAIFGSGLVETPEDFGTRAPQPEHLELLNWLAVDFMEHNWSVKHLVRTILNSATYQQDSRVTPEHLERDPRNRLLARGPRFRAEAEVIRDIALSASGLLNPKLGGPSIFPPVPQSVLDYNFFKPDYWVPAQGADRYRRSLYVFRKRSMPDPVLSSFDAPNADFACAARVRSNTPLAALVSLNEPVFLEAARALALRVLKEGGKSDRERIDYAYRLCTSRPARPAEEAALLKLLKSHRERFADGWLSINEVATGDPAQRPAVPSGATPQDAAVWTIAARVLLNLDETLSKN